MKIIRKENYDNASRQAANIVSAQIIMKPSSVLGLATGSSPIGLYSHLVERYKKGDIDFSQIYTVNLDEYYGLAPEHEQSFNYFMQKHLFNHINIKKDRTNILNGLATDPETECVGYDRLIDSYGGIDLQLLGIGHDGHIGFNEPGKTFELETHLVNLTQTTIDANSRFFEKKEDVPTQALTMGIRTIMQAQKILVIVSGKDKADVVKQAFFGPVTPTIPASILQIHKDVILIGDEDALSLI